MKYLIRANNFNATMKIWYIVELKARVGSANTTLLMGSIINWVSKLIK